MRDERNIPKNTISKNFNRLFYYFFLMIYFSMTVLGYEILKLRSFFREKFYDRSLSSFHFCQWHFLNATSAIENEILQLNYRDPSKSANYIQEIKNLFKNNFSYGSIYDEFCRKIQYCGVYYIKNKQLNYKIISPSGNDNNPKPLFSLSMDNWRYSCHTIRGVQRASSDKNTVETLLQSKNDIFYNHIEDKIYMNSVNNDDSNLFLLNSPNLYIREGRLYFLKAGHMKLFINLNPEIEQMVLFSSMFSDCRFLQNPQFQEIQYKAILYGRQQYSLSEYIDDSAAANALNVNSTSSIIDFINDDLSITYPSNLEVLQKFVKDFESNLFEYFPDFFKNLNYNTEPNSTVISTKLMLDAFISKVKKFSEMFFSKINLNMLKLINALNTDEHYERILYEFDDIFELKLTFGNFFYDIFSKKTSLIPMANDALVFQIKPSFEESSNLKQSYFLLVEKPKLFIHDYVSFSIGISPILLGSSYKFNFPIYQSLSANLFNTFNSQNAYVFNSIQYSSMAYTLYQDQALAMCFWLNFKNSIAPDKATLRVSDIATFYSEKGQQIGNRGIQSSFDFELTSSSAETNLLRLQYYYESDIINSLDKPSKVNLLTSSREVPKKMWNHVCIFQYQIKPERIIDKDSSSKNRYRYEIYINDNRSIISLDTYDVGLKFSSLYPKTYLTNPYPFNASIKFLKGARSISDVNRNAIFSDLKLFKFTADVTTRKDSQGNLVGLPDERIIQNLFFTAKFLKITKFADDLLSIGGTLDSAFPWDAFSKAFTLLTPQKATDIAVLDAFKFQDFFNNLNSANYNNFNSIFQLGYPKILLLENYINIEVMFDGDFIIKSFQKAVRGTTQTGLTNELDLDYNFIQLRISDFEGKNAFNKNLDFYGMQFKQEAFFPMSNIDSRNRFFYHFIMWVEIKNSFDPESPLKKDTFEFKLFVNYINLERPKAALFVNNGISEVSNFDRNYLLPKTLSYPLAVESIVKYNYNEFIRNSYLDVNKIQENFLFYKYFPSVNNGFEYSYNLKFNQALVFSRNRNLIIQSSLVPLSYSEISNAENNISFRFVPKQVTKTYNKNTFTFYSLFSFNYNENFEMQMIKPFMNSFESSYQTTQKNAKILDLDLKIPFKEENIEVLLTRNYYPSEETQCVLFTIKARYLFIFQKKFKAISDEPNLTISIFYVKSYKNTATYCLRIERIGFSNQSAPVPPEFVRVYSLTTVRDSSAIKNDSNSKALFYLKFVPVEELFFNRIRSEYSNQTYFAPQSIHFNVLIQRVTTEIFFYDFVGAKRCVLHINSSLYPVTFIQENLELDLIKSGYTTKITAYEQLEQNLVTFSISDLESLDDYLSNSITAFLLPFEELKLDYGKMRISVIKNCSFDQLIQVIKTDYRDIYYNFFLNSEIIFSVFESKATFVFNKHCFNEYNITYSIETFDKTTSSNNTISPDILAIDILSIKSISINFALKGNGAENSFIIRARKEEIELISAYLNKIQIKDSFGYSLDYYINQKRLKKSFLNYRLDYEVSNRFFINDKIDTLNTCYMQVYETIEGVSSKLDDSRSFNNCFRGFFEYNLDTNKELFFHIRIKEFTYKKDFNIVFGFFKNVEVNFTKNTGDENNKDKISLKIIRDSITTVSKIDCFKRIVLNLKTLDTKINKVIQSKINSNWIKLFDIKENEIPAFSETSKDLKFERNFNFYNNQTKFNFDNKAYNELYRYYNSTDQLYCKVCYYYRDDYCFVKFSNSMGRIADILQPDPDPIPPKPSPVDPIPVPINNTTNTTDKNTTDNNGSTINPTPIPNPKPDPNNKTNTTENNSTNNNSEPIDIPKRIDIITNPLRNDTYIIGNYTMKNQEEKKKELQEYLDKIKKDNNTKEDQKEIMQTTVTINNLISNTNCSSFTNKEDCTQKLKETQKAVVEKVSEILDCKEIFKTIFGVENPSEKMLFSALTLYYSTSNYEYFDSKNMMKMKDVTSCLVNNSQDILSKIYNKTDNKTNLEIIKNDYLNILTSSTSNLISISKVNSQEIVKGIAGNDGTNINDPSNNKLAFDDYKNASLVLTVENIAVKKVIEENSVVLMKLTLGGEISDNYTAAVNSTSTFNRTQGSFNLKTKNFHIYSRKIDPSSSENKNSTNNPARMLRLLREIAFLNSANKIENQTTSQKHETNYKNILRKKYLNRLLSSEYEIIKINTGNLDVRIHLPIEYLTTKYNKNITSYGVIQYFKYPLLSPQNKNFSENVVSINLYDSSFTAQKVRNLTVPIELFIKKPHKSFNNCLFIDPDSSYNWNDEGCKAFDLGDYLHCSCNHLTDFSISKYNPVRLINDMMNVLSEAWIINDFTVFSELNYANAATVYIFFGILVLYFIGLVFTISYDVKDIHDNFIYEGDNDAACCDTKQTLENIMEVKQVADEAEEERIKKSLKQIEVKLDKYKLDAIVAKTLGLDVILPHKSKKTDANGAAPAARGAHKVSFNDGDGENVIDTESSIPTNKRKATFLSMYLNRGKKATLADSPKMEQKTKPFPISNSKQEIELNDISNTSNKKDELLISPEKEAQSQRPKTIKKLKFFLGNENQEKEKKEETKNEEREVELNESNNPLETNMSMIIPLNEKEHKASDDTDLKIIDTEQDLKKKSTLASKEDSYSNSKDKRSAIGILVEGLKVKVANYTLSHEDFILNLYNSKNEELQKEIMKFFVIKKSKILEKGNKNDANSNSKESKSNKTSSENKKDLSSLSSDKSLNVEDSGETNEKSINLDDSSLSITKKAGQNLLQYEINQGENEDADLENQNTNSLRYHIKLKYSMLIRFLQLIVFFFKTEYRLINIFMKQFNIVTKTTMWTLIIFRLLVSLTICAMLSSRSDNEQKSSTGYVFTNRDLAVAMVTILITEFPFTFIETHLTKRKVMKEWSIEKKEQERAKSKKYLIITYICLGFIFAFGVTNTTWISLKFKKVSKEHGFYKQFYLATIFDYFVYEIIILLTKSLIYFLLIKDTNLPWWKKFLISIIAAMPWAFSMFG